LYSQHFSTRLKPWVHYVPLSYSMADAVEKIEWLIKNDDKAQQIAQNAANYGKSYLRMEDYFCYSAASLKLVADMEKASDILEPYNATLWPAVKWNIRADVQK
jgi:hypothetical protein